MNQLQDLVRDSLLRTSFPEGGLETVHTYHERSSQGRRPVVRSERWIRQGKIGQGSFGNVWREERADGDKDKPAVRAVKEINRKGGTKDLECARELEAIAKFSQRKYDQLGCFVKSSGWYYTDESLFIAMEYLEFGDLQTYLKPVDRPPLPEHEAQDIIFQILLGLHEMHDNKFVHRDLKLGNILIASCPPNDWWVKLADFGISKRIEESQGTATAERGTPGYMAPELQGFAKHEESDQYPADIWAAGETTFRLLTKTPAFRNAGAVGEYMKDAHSFPFAPLHEAKVSGSGVDFILALMRPLPGDRATTSAALDHGWIQPIFPTRANSHAHAHAHTHAHTHAHIHSIPAAWNGPYTNASVEAMTEEFASWNTVTSANPETTVIQSKPESSTRHFQSRTVQPHYGLNAVALPPPPESQILRPAKMPSILPPRQHLPGFKHARSESYIPRLSYEPLHASRYLPSKLDISATFSLSDSEQEPSKTGRPRISNARSYQDISSAKETTKRRQHLPLPFRSPNRTHSQESSREYYLPAPVFEPHIMATSSSDGSIALPFDHQHAPQAGRFRYGSTQVSGQHLPQQPYGSRVARDNQLFTTPREFSGNALKMYSPGIISDPRNYNRSSATQQPCRSRIARDNDSSTRARNLPVGNHEPASSTTQPPLDALIATGSPYEQPEMAISTKNLRMPPHYRTSSSCEGSSELNGAPKQDMAFSGYHAQFLESPSDMYWPHRSRSDGASATIQQHLSSTEDLALDPDERLNSPQQHRIRFEAEEEMRERIASHRTRRRRGSLKAKAVPAKDSATQIAALGDLREAMKKYNDSLTDFDTPPSERIAMEMEMDAKYQRYLGAFPGSAQTYGEGQA
ncbi:kinase-like domain-containing protein [Aspergillus pseudoustus]|uniref:Serine/threonine-protein kinase ATG1 n=1 Tax=Aspergillus pseudoustus TaxID=1810923 RepID=A0ABR4JK36_9EURO